MEKKTLTKEERVAHNLKVLQGIAKFSKVAIDKMKANGVQGAKHGGGDAIAPQQNNVQK